jgi:D-alanine-D-alanine ligase
MIVKPKNEAVSFGLKVVHDEAELREAAGVIFEKFRQPVLAEAYIEGREINVGLLGNDPPEAFPPVELTFGKEGPPIYTYEDKTGKSGREIVPVCPAPIPGSLRERAQEIAKGAFTALGCYDCARVDMRLDSKGNLYILEVNSLPSLGEHGSYLVGAANVGMDFTAFVNRLVEVASARYFGTPSPPTLARAETDPSKLTFSYLTERRDRIEGRLRDWSRVSTRTSDPIGLREGVRQIQRLFDDLKMKKVDELTDDRSIHFWQTAKGFEKGTLLVAHLDVPVDSVSQPQAFRREPEWILGEGMASAKAPLVALEFSLRSLRSLRRLRRLPLGVLVYTDEGVDCRYSASLIREAASRARQVLVLNAGNEPDSVVTQRRGVRKYRLRVHDRPLRPGQARTRPDALRWAGARLEQIAKLGSRKEHLSVSAMDVVPRSFPMLLPHQVTASLLMTYLDARLADATEKRIRELLGKKGPQWELNLMSDRPPMKERRSSGRLVREIEATAKEWEIPLRRRTSVWPSAAGLVPSPVAVVCGVGPHGRDLFTPNERVQRIGLIQRTLLLAQFLAAQLGK